MKVHFVFVGEGTSDDALIPHLESLCIHAGACEAFGTSVDFGRLPAAIGRTVEAKLRAARLLEPQANLVFVHRDTDARDGTGRHEEIAAAAQACGHQGPLVAVVPTQETEAWLLLDETAIRRAVGRPNGRARLDLPRPAGVERLANPKEKLQEALQLASEATGRRLERIRQDFPRHRRALLEDLPIVGAIEQLTSWQRMRDDLRVMLEAMR